MTLPTVMTVAGLQPTSPTDLNTALIALVSASNPGYTVLPGGLIEDISSTDVGALTIIDQARVDLVNSVTPLGANAFLLPQLGQIYGVQQGVGYNTSVYVVFTGTAGFAITKGFTVSDGTYQYVVQDGGVISAVGGQSLPLFCLATQSGSWPVPINTVSNFVTSVPTGVTLTCTNPTAGTPGVATGQTLEDYRAQVLQAGNAVAQGMATFLKTQLQKVPGVQARLVSVRLINGLWEILCGGGDPYQVANAIFQGIFDLGTITGSTLLVSNITNANPGVITTGFNHGFTTGQVINITGVVGTTGINGVALTITVISPTSFSIGINTTTNGAYVSGGVITPNLRNVTVSINDYPDIYPIIFVNPPLQTVGISLLWNTLSTNFVSAASVAQLGAPALVNYINSIYVGQPINVFELQIVFQTAIASIIPPTLLSRMVFSVTINGILVNPVAGTGVINGDPESYFLTSSANIVINQG